MTWLWSPLLLVQSPIIATTVGGVVPACRRHLRATPEVDQRNGDVAECGERLVRVSRSSGGVVLAKDRIAEPEQALNAPVRLPQSQLTYRSRRSTWRACGHPKSGGAFGHPQRALLEPTVCYASCLRLAETSGQVGGPFSNVGPLPQVAALRAMHRSHSARQHDRSRRPDPAPGRRGCHTSAATCTQSIRYAQNREHGKHSKYMHSRPIVPGELLHLSSQAVLYAPVPMLTRLEPTLPCLSATQ